MSTYELLPTVATFHSHFAADLPPVLTIGPGDRVVSRVQPRSVRKRKVSGSV